MQNDFTPHQSLPLPHPDNDLEGDVIRLRNALSAIDAKFHAIDVLLSSDDVALDEIQELVDAIKANRTDIVSLLVAKADKKSVDAAMLFKANSADVATSLATKLDKTGGTLAGPLTLSRDAQNDMEPVTKRVLDAKLAPLAQLHAAALLF